MSTRPLWLMGMVSALAVPYLSLDGNVPHWVQQSRQQIFGTSAGAPAFSDMGSDLSQSHEFYAANYGGGLAAGSNGAAQTPIVPLEEVLRADVQPGWVLSRWPQVGTVVAEMDMSGLRVPLITGFQPHDIVGSLTYYFDKEQRLRRIAILGNSSDERYIVSLATQNFGLKPEATLQSGLFVQRWNREPLSVLQIELAPFLTPDSQQPTRRIQLEINRPMSGCHLSDEMRAHLQTATGGL